tara:strand:- start:322 stop:807 length:486 start_codon:yes stop_codon:yes gene_type:complete
MKFDKKKADPFLLEEGDYYFEVLEATDTVFELDDQPVPQIKIVLRLSWDTEQGERTSLLNQWLCSETRVYLLRQFLYSVGLSDDWEAGEVDSADLFGLSGSCRVEQYEHRKTGKMRNKVAEWYPLEEADEVEEKPKKKRKKAKAKSAKESYGTDLDDDIPF